MLGIDIADIINTFKNAKLLSKPKNLQNSILYSIIPNFIKKKEKKNIYKHLYTYGESKLC